MHRQTGDQASLFYGFRLEDSIPNDHLLKCINVFVTSVLGGVREQHECSYYLQLLSSSPFALSARRVFPRTYRRRSCDTCERIHWRRD